MSEYNWVELGNLVGTTGVDVSGISSLSDIKCVFTFTDATIASIEFIIKAEDVNNYFIELHRYQQGLSDKEPERNWGRYGTNSQPPYMEFDVELIEYHSDDNDIRYLVKLVKCITAVEDITSTTHVTYYKDVQLTEPTE